MFCVSMEEGQVSLAKELNQGKELAMLLCNRIASSTHETNELLIDKILCSYEKALKMLTRGQNVGEANPTVNAGESPRCDVLDQEDGRRDAYKKRKIMPRWTEQVKVCSRTGIEGSLDDGYSWRKYGQKDILGAKFPRGYYRCTHRFVQGCQATKQVQRSDEDPTVFEVTYRGKHTCNNHAAASKKKMVFGENHHNNQHRKRNEEEEEEEKMEPSLMTFFNFEPELEVKMEDIFPTSTGFPSTSDNQFLENFSANFISPSTSESNLFSLSPCHMGSAGICQKVQSSESEVTDVVSAPTSVTNSPLVDLDVLLEKEDFQSNFPFSTFDFFSS
ncbi:probable WRKY transcription factor 46 [Neltuma alba]|uniref:probable WRKY transcription factor 46 n=1 Tax=Neltuma alba TaxID=207710 RepID=UPI0010A43FE7|nr:probable WRKY transcription factor 46 [Prosopis alba]